MALCNKACFALVLMSNSHAEKMSGFYCGKRKSFFLVILEEIVETSIEHWKEIISENSADGFWN